MAESTPQGSGAAARPSAPADDGILRIRGGLGGLSFQFEELLAGAGALDGLVRELATLEMEADAVRRDLFPYQADSHSSGTSAIIAAGEGSRVLGRVRNELEGLCRDVRASHRAAPAPWQQPLEQRRARARDCPRPGTPHPPRGLGH
jgi:hypothetical protein